MCIDIREAFFVLWEKSDGLVEGAKGQSPTGTNDSFVERNICYLK